ncbi:hypothetical protein ACFYPK_33495 [Streptomyces halstedii]|uniref:effector-associated constant component EACC1 n=1 Tax=Streptomyces halstedii TaxID=1944 RepID=UPI00346005D8|nr:hypothetical protein OG291_18120 [Streptomyces halstedii]
MNVTVTITGDGVADELRSLHEWLIAEEELRGRVRLMEAPPSPGTLGTVPEMLTIALAPGGVTAVLASAAIAWMRHRTGEVTCKLTRPGGTSVEFTAQRVRGTDMTEVRELVDRLADMLEGDPGVVDGDQGESTVPTGQ